jgi:hypothetical protein
VPLSCLAAGGKKAARKKGGTDLNLTGSAAGSVTAWQPTTPGEVRQHTHPPFMSDACPFKDDSRGAVMRYNKMEDSPVSWPCLMVA